jgi:NhaA family Na+:H+ antiporter
MLSSLRVLFKSESAGGILLIVAAGLALVCANGAFQGSYETFLHFPMFNGTLAHWINDGLMAVFFLIVGLEVKKELVEGSLAGKDKAMFPLVAAVGGMVIPALVYLLFNFTDDIGKQGWAIPAATDIAFALGVMALLGKRVPASLKAFLMALAIIDDLGAIVIIALFYTQSLSLLALAAALGTIAVLAVLNRKNVSCLWPYLIVGCLLWFCLLQSGVHATLAGVIVGFFIPLRTPAGKTPLDTLVHSLHPWVTFIILPIFAFANAGVSLDGISFDTLLAPIPLGIALGLLLGKPLGIFIFSWLAILAGWVKMPEELRLSHIFAVSILCGIGFTMSIFIASLAFVNESADYMVYSRLGILLGSTIAAVAGYLMLKATLKKA